MSQETKEFSTLYKSYQGGWSIAASRIACVLVVVLIMGGSVLDWATHRAQMQLFFFYRTATAMSAAALFGLSFFEGAKKYAKALFLLPILFTALCIQMMIQQMPEGYTSSYYAGLNLCILGFAITVTMSLLETMAVCFGIVGMWIVGAVVGNRPIEFGSFFNNLFFLTGTSMIAIGSTLIRNKVAEREFRSYYAHRMLEELDTLKSQFFANVSHELRTPLTLAMGPVETVLTTVKELPEVAREYLEIARRNQVRLHALINTLLDFAKIEAGKEKLVVRRLDLNAVLNGLLDGFKHRATEQKLTFSVSLPNKPVELFIDREKFEKIVINLLSNAFKFTEPGGRIEVTVNVEAEHITISVTDTGIGIDEKQQQHVFERFGQVDASNTRKYGGTGIGLALVKEYTELHGGNVSLRSAPGKGSTFTLSFLCGRTHFKDDVIIEEESEQTIASLSSSTQMALLDVELQSSQHDLLQPISTPAPGSGQVSQELNQGLNDMSQMHLTDSALIAPSLARRPSVLIVDDTLDMRAYVKSLIAHAYDVHSASDGQEGLELARKLSPDLILTDLMMPRMGGDELCKAIKAEPAPLCDTPVVLLTARADEQTKVQTLNYGADDYLLKPFSAEELQSRVRNLVIKRRQALALALAHQSLRFKQDYINGDLETAARFLKSLLSTVIKVPAPLSAHVVFHPADAVGGDFYHARSLGDDRSRLLIADITGHGVKAAFRAIAAWSEYTSLDHHELNPAQVLSTLNKIALEKYRDLTGCFFCGDVCVEKSGQVRIDYAQAGECPGVIVSRAGDMTQLKPTNGFILGMLPQASFALATHELKKGDRLFLHTDGLDEQEDRNGRFYGDTSLTNALINTCAFSDIEEATQSVYTDFVRFHQSQEGAMTTGSPVPQLDDVTIIGIEV